MAQSEHPPSRSSQLLAGIVWRWARPSWPLAAGAVAANLVAAGFEGLTFGSLVLALHAVGGNRAWSAPLPPWLTAWVAQIEQATSAHTFFLWCILAAVLTQVLRSGCQFAAEAWTAHLQVRVHTAAHRELFARIVRMPFARSRAYALGDLTDYLGQAVHLFRICARVNDLIRTTLFLVVYAGLLLWLSWPLTLIVAVVCGGLNGLLRRVVVTVRRHAIHHTNAAVALSEQVTEFLQALRLLHTFARQEEAVQTVDRLARDGMWGRLRAATWSGAVEPITDVLTIVGMGAFLIGGVLVLVPRGLVSLPILPSFLLVLYRFTPRLRTLYASLASLASLVPSLDRMAELLREGVSVAPAARNTVPPLRSGITFRDVTMRYRRDESPAVAGLSLTIPRGHFMALVGSSGAGKSTLMDLLIGLIEPTEGAVLVDGVDLRDLDPAAWRQRLGVVSQDCFLFRATIRENITYGRPEATSEEIATAARAAHAEEFILRLADRYDTMVGERGTWLSAGQRQRVALARALIRHPEVLILDEATSALDSESERHIQRALDEQRGIRTVVAIAHRLSTVVHADKIVVLADGRIVERGTHHGLLAQGGVYARLWDLQSEHPSAAAAWQPEAA